MVEVTSAFEIEISWERAPGVTSPEIGATWARMVVKVDGRVVTLLSGADGTPRSGLYISAYPLAEWIAFNWWALTNEVQVSSVPSAEWTWACATPNSWLQRHNLRAAGGGMQWPDLTIVPEGAVTSVTWSASEPQPGGRGLQFLTPGRAILASDAVTEALAQFVETVLERLREKAVRETPLEREWLAITAMEADELAFAASAGRLGIDPFSLDDVGTDEIMAIGRQYERELGGEILDASESSVEVLHEVTEWLHRATQMAAPSGGSPAAMDLLLDSFADLETAVDPYRPWRAGYAGAMRVRGLLEDVHGGSGIGAVSTLIDGLAAEPVSGRAGALEGFTMRAGDRALLLVPDKEYAPARTQQRFLKARSLGAHLLERERTRFILTRSRTPLQQAARAFAAELLAPAEVIREMLMKLGGHADSSAFEAIAGYFVVSPFVIQHQYENQIARGAAAELSM